MYVGSYAESTESSITINENLNWLFPGRTFATNIDTGELINYPAPTALAIGLGIDSMDTLSFQMLVILHELKHMFDAPQENEGNAVEFNMVIVRECLPELVQ